MGAVLVSAANERGQMLSGLRTPGLILFDESVLGLAVRRLRVRDRELGTSGGRRLRAERETEEDRCQRAEGNGSHFSK